MSEQSNAHTNLLFALDQTLCAATLNFNLSLTCSQCVARRHLRVTTTICHPALEQKEHLSAADLFDEGSQRVYINGSFFMPSEAQHTKRGWPRRVYKIRVPFFIPEKVAAGIFYTRPKL